VRALADRFPLDWRVLLSGYFPEYAYDLGSLDTDLPFTELKAQNLINDRTQAADQAADFSARIRQGLPMLEPRLEPSRNANGVAAH
jgi:hypothetical protein